MICCVLAAGMATRFKGNKLCASINGKPLIAHVVSGLPNDLKKIYIITGHYHEEIQNISFSKNVEIIYNENYRDGKWTSLKIARDLALKSNADLLVTLGDLPLLKELDYNKLIEIHKEYGKMSTFSSYYEVNGPPAIITRDALESLEVTKSSKLRELVNNYNVMSLPNAGIDLDRVEDIAKVSSLLS